MDKRVLGSSLLSLVLMNGWLASGQDRTQVLNDCTADKEQAWNEIWQRSLGVEGVDPERYSIQSVQPPVVRWPAATDGLHQWVPLGPRKAKLCGAVRGHRPYCPQGYLRVFSECDRNAFILPAPGYEYLRDEPIQNKLVTDPSKLVCCKTARECSDPGEWCIETEITPSREILMDEALYHSFTSLLGPASTGDEDSAATKPWLWREMCTYGPWVGDSGHGTRPEIHPVQLRWTREANTRSLMLMVMQDASARFTERRNFVHRHRPANDWNPWAEAPVQGLFRVAFQADPKAPPRIRITREMGNHIRASEPDTCRETEEGCVVERALGGAPLLRVFKMMPSRDVHVQIEPLCRRSDGLVIGYIEIEAAVGHEGCEEEGYLILRVEEMPGTAGSPALSYVGNPLFKEGSAAESPPTEKPHKPRLGGGITRVRPGDLRRAEGTEAEAAWRELLAELSSIEVASPLRQLSSPPVPIVRAQKWEISAEPHYEGAAEVEPLEEAATDLNEAIAEREGKKIRQLIPSAGAFHMNAPNARQNVVDLTRAGRAVPVNSQVAHEREASPSESAIQIEPWNLSNWSPGVRIRIPKEPPGAVYRVCFHASLEDESEESVEVEYSFLSHGLDGESYQKLIEVLLPSSPETAQLTLAGLLKMATVLDDPWEDNRAASSRASQLLVLAESFGEDGIITSDELEGIAQLFRKFRDACAFSRRCSS